MPDLACSDLVMINSSDFLVKKTECFFKFKFYFRYKYKMP